MLAKTAEAAAARHFEQVCKELHAEPLYVVYRSLSASCHPSTAAVGHYVDFERRVFGKEDVRQQNQAVLPTLWTTAATLLWSSRALDELVMHKPRKPQLRSVTKRTGIPSFLL